MEPIQDQDIYNKLGDLLGIPEIQYQDICNKLGNLLRIKKIGPSILEAIIEKAEGDGFEVEIDLNGASNFEDLMSSQEVSSFEKFADILGNRRSHIYETCYKVDGDKDTARAIVTVGHTYKGK